jgi:hypothetical protein
MNHEVKIMKVKSLMQPIPYTLVTGFWDINRDRWGTYYSRPVTKYFENFKRICSLYNDMVVYIDPKYYNDVVKMVATLKVLGRTRIIPLNYEQLDGYKYERNIQSIMDSDEFKQGLADPFVPEVTQPAYDVVIWSKVSLLKKTLDENPHGYDCTFGVAWLDFGIHSHMLPDNYLNTFLIGPGLKSSRVQMMYRSLPLPEDSDIKTFFKSHTNRITAPFISGTKETITEFYDLEQKIIKEALELGVVDCEQSVYAIAYLRRPLLFKLFHGDWNDILKNFE